MTISTTTSRVTFSGDGSTTVFTIPFLFYNNTDILVVKTASGGGTATLVLGSDYTLSGAGVSSGGTLTKTTALATGETMAIILSPPFTQTSHFVSNQTFPSSAVEQSLDKVVQLNQRLNDLLGRSLRAPDSDSNVSGFTLPSATSRANTYLSFDSNGNPQTSVTISGATLSQTLIGTYLWPQTAAEVAASVTPVNYAYPATNSTAYISRYLNLSTALAVAGSTNPFTLIIDSAISVGSSQTIPANVSLQVIGAGSIAINSGQTLTVNGPVLSNKTSALTFPGAGATVFGYNGNQFILGGLTIAGSAQTTPVTLTYTPSLTINCATSNVFRLTLTGPVTLLLLTNAHDGQTINLKITQTGTYNFAWGSSIKWPGGTAVSNSITAGAVDHFTATYHADTNVWYGSLSKAFA
jgi:hypothetical protein